MKRIYSIIKVILFFSFSVFGQTNIGFESTIAGAYTTSNAVNGWTIRSKTATSCNSSTAWTPGSPEFSIIATPQLSIPNIGILPNSPLGGTIVAQLNNYSANGSVTKLTHTISVTSLNAYIQLAYAGIWQSGTHSCCEQSGLKILLYDQIGNPITCPSYTLAGSGCSSIPTHSISGNASWTNWQILSFVLSGYIGSVITMEIESYDCIYGDHYGTVFFDAKTNNCNCTYSSIYPTINYDFCTGSSLATLNGPVGYGQYLWTAPSSASISPSQATLSSISITNAVVGNIYTLSVHAASGYCSYTNTFALVNTSLTISGIGASPSCSIGTSGSATVVASGSGSGYNYTWINSTNSIVTNSPTLTSLAPGIYTVNVTAAGSQSLSCGTATATTTVGVLAPGVINLLKPFCGIEAYLSYPGGSNYQWYNNLSPITASLGGTASSYTVSAPVNSAIYRLSYISPQGCHDSLKITLIQTPSGNLGLLSNAIICQGATNGTAVISMTPAAGAPQGLNSFSVFSVGSTPPYSSSTNSFSLNTFTATSLSAGSLYSVSAFDGLCKYSTSFTVPAFTFNYSLTSTSPTICSGNNVAANVSFSATTSLGEYTYSWSPTTFLLGATSQNAIISPTTNPGNQITLTYSVVVTPTIANCPLTKTLSVVVANPNTPTISSIPILCSNSMSAYSISVNPPGGTFSGGGIGLTSVGTIMPAFSSIGTFTFLYTTPPQNNCTATSAGNYTVDYSPVINPLGNQLSICNGQAGTLNVTSTESYTWSTGVVNAPITVTPATTNTYSVFALNASHTCSTEIALTLTVIPIPTISISGNLICSGNSATLTASGATSYSWNNGSNSSVIIVPSTNGTPYTVVGANSQTCINTSSTTLNVVPSPSVTISGNTILCEGQSTTLLANGADTYFWSNLSTGPLTTITPSTYTQYTVTGTTFLGNCSNSQTIAVNVIPHPTIAISGNTILCLGESATLTANGANTYNWSTGSNNQSIVVTPASTKSYSVTGSTTIANCTSTQSITIKVNSCSTTRLDELFSNSNITIYPNPSKGIFSIATNHKHNIIITDLIGKIILEKNYEAGKNEIDLSNYPNGVYQLKIFSNGETKITKLVKSN